MAADSDGCTQDLTTVVTCEGNLGDPAFEARFKGVVDQLNSILGEAVKVHKLEPWNSVRVTLSIPREAALRLRKLASEGSAQLRALGILSVQVEGDQVISLRIANSLNAAEPQEILLQTTQDGSGSSRSSEADGALSRLLAGPSTSVVSATATVSTPVPPPPAGDSTEKIHFKSPNVVCPSDSVVPKVPSGVLGGATQVTNSNNSTSGASPSPIAVAKSSFGGPFPFASMNQAMHTSRDANHPAAQSQSQPPPPQPTVPPPPYPGNKHHHPHHHHHPTVTMSSPLLVNLLQNDGAQKKSETSAHASNSVVKAATSTSALPPPPPVIVNRTMIANNQHQTVFNSNRGGANKEHATDSGALAALIHNTNNNNNSSKSVVNHLQLPLLTKQVVQQPMISSSSSSASSQASTSSPSALNHTSIRQNNSKLNSTMYGVAATSAVVAPSRNLPPPPPYSVAMTNRQWDSVVQSAAALMDLTPTLTDLKPDDLDALIPSLERDLARSPLEIPEELTNSRPHTAERNFLINPLTGELEPQSSGDESGPEELGDVFTGLPSPALLSDEDTNSTIRPDTMTDQSDSETRSSHSDSGKHSRIKSKVRDRGRDSPGLLKPAALTVAAAAAATSATEKIKLRLKLEKSEPVNAAYKVDVSFIQQQPKKATALSPSSEELRVPPLHISLRGRHHFITNKKKAKLHSDKPKVRKDAANNKTPLQAQMKREESAITMNEESSNQSSGGGDSVKPQENPEKKQKKSNHENGSKEMLLQDSDLLSKLVMGNATTANHFKEKHKERRGSDSELSSRTSNHMKFVDTNNGQLEKRRRLSQSETTQEQVVQPPAILGSTNVGTIASLPQQKPRKEKSGKLKEAYLKSKELARNNKNFNKIGENYMKQVTLPMGEIDMEAKFKQRLLEGSEKGISRPPHRTDESSVAADRGNVVPQIDDTTDKIPSKAEPDPTSITSSSSSSSTSSLSTQAKSPEEEPDKCNTPDRNKQTDLGDKQVVARSPNSGTGQGEDSGIESMDALSEKSPNQASQSPHDADLPEQPPLIAPSTGHHTVGNKSALIKAKMQVPDMLDIEAQLAKMEGLNGVGEEEEDEDDEEEEDVRCENSQQSQLQKLQDSLKHGAVTLSSCTAKASNAGVTKEQTSIQSADITLVSIKSKTGEDDHHEPIPVRVTPPLYTYSNPEKSRGSDSPTLSEEEFPSTTNHHPPQPQSQQQQQPPAQKSKSLLEQLLIDIPDGSQTAASSSPSPPARSVRTRALSKLNSPELNNSPVPQQLVKQTRNPTGGATSTTSVTTTTTTTTSSNVKRRRNESDSSAEDGRTKKARKSGDNGPDPVKSVGKMADVAAVLTTTTAPSAVKVNNVKKAHKLQDESSDSDEPLIEKVRKTAAHTNSVTVATPTAKTKVKSGGGVGGGGGGVKSAVGTRRSVRAVVPTPNTRSKGDRVGPDVEAIRRKTRSADGESKRKKEIK